MNWKDRLKEKWELDSMTQLWAILAVFTLAGSSVVWCRKGLFWLLSYTEDTPFWLKTITYIVFIFPTYQLLLLFYGFILGQFNFFWKKEKKLFARVFNR